MNKQDIFPLYVGKCKVKVNNVSHNKPYAYYGFNAHSNILHLVLEGHTRYSDISDCQLILKRLSGISEEDKKECRNLMIAIINKDSPKFNAVFDYNEWRYFHTARSILRLVQNGYALSDEWFTNGIAVEAGK